MIRFAKQTDIEDIMEFINQYWWRKDILLGKDRTFFEYEHLIYGEVTFVISKSDEGKIDGLLGYIPFGKKQRDVIPVMWKTNHTRNTGLGIKLLEFLHNNGDINILASPGIKQKETKALFAYLGYHFGQMTHWYRLNKREKYFIAKIENAMIPDICAEPIEFLKLESWEQLKTQFDFEDYYRRKPKPLKESWYIKKRYFEHPVYKYEVYGIKEGSEVKTIFVFRHILANESSMLKFIDCIGDWEKIGKAVSMIDQLLNEYNAEYIDCYEAGLPKHLFEESGWMRTSDTENIIPNYFEPFEQKNIEVYYISSDPEIVLFRGDGDQDRPN